MSQELCNALNSAFGKPVEDQHCINCKYYNGTHCRRFPPTVITQSMYPDYNWSPEARAFSMGNITRYPQPDLDWWCGEWAPQSEGSAR